MRNSSGRGEASPLHERSGLRPEAPSREPDHTPPPWRVTRNGSIIAGDDSDPVGVAEGSRYGTKEAEANAALIVRAVNHHDKLVSALRGLLDTTEMLGPPSLRAARDQAFHALAAIEGGTK